jgi:hypothetical protein
MIAFFLNWRSVVILCGGRLLAEVGIKHPSQKIKGSEPRR